LKKPAHRLHYELLTIGDELLLGLTANGHLTFIGSELSARGVQLKRNVTVTDDAEDIAAQFRESWGRADVVLITGGLGPTCDDRTREAVAGVLGQKLVFDPSIERHILDRFALFGRKMTPNNLKQAYRFERGDVLANSNGTAPGLWVEQDGKVLCMMPGPPNELRPMFTEQVIPRLAALGLVLESEAYVQLRTAGIGESILETKLQPLFDRHGPNLGIAFCAHAGHVDCRLSSPGGQLSMADVGAIADECAQLLGEDFVTRGCDSLAKVCADLLRSQETRREARCRLCPRDQRVCRALRRHKREPGRDHIRGPPRPPWRLVAQAELSGPQGHGETARGERRARLAQARARSRAERCGHAAPARECHAVARLPDIRFRRAARYFSRVLSITPSGSLGAGGFWSQERPSR